MKEPTMTETPRTGAIDIVCNLFTPEEVRNRQTGLDDTFKSQVRMADDMREGVTIEAYLKKMDRAGIERSLLIAVRCGDLKVRGSFEIPYQRVADICAQYPDRFSGLAGVDPFRGMQGLRDLEAAVRDHGFVGAHLYPHWFGLAPDDAKYYPYYAKCCELDIPIQMQVGQSLIYRKDMPLRSTGRPICLDAVACDFPELKLIGIHVGIPWTSEMIAMAWKHPNVHIISDAHSPKYWPPEFVRYIDTYGQDKVMFGTDFPVLGFERTRREIEALEIRPGSMVKFMRENARKLYRLP
jgi:predicted TIM-barrel fold metal-dependent hydrolase